MKGFAQAQSIYDNMHPPDDNTDQLYNEALDQARELPQPDWMSEDMKGRYVDAQTERIFGELEAMTAEEWHDDAIEFCTCSYCKAEWKDEYEESIEVLKQENITTWRK